MAEIEKEPTPMTPSDAGRKGGKTVWGRYGEDYYRRIGKQGGTTLKEKRGSEYYRQIARLGGQANVRTYGPDHFSEMGKKGGNTTKQRQDPDFYRRIGKIGGSVKRQKKEVPVSPGPVTRTPRDGGASSQDQERASTSGDAL